MINPRLVGDRTYRGEVVASDVYPPILDRATGAEVLSLLTSKTKGERSLSLLSGLLICGKCGENLIHGSTGAHRKPTRIYQCGGRRGCNGIGITATLVEGWVRDAVCERIEARWPRGGLPGTDEFFEDELAAIRDHAGQFRRLNQSYFVHRDITRAEYLHTRRHLLDRHARERRRRQPTMRPAQVPTEVDLTRIGEHWARLDRAAQRSLIELELSSITVKPSPTRGGCIFDPDRLQARWIRVGVYPTADPASTR